MPAFASSLTRSAIVARLRAAGCVFAEDEARLLMSAAATPAELSGMVERRAAGEPIEHVVGWAEFCGLRIAVDPGVFVPRRRTEFLVARAIALTRQPGPPTGHGPVPGEASPRTGDTGRAPVVVVDLCCGSGAVGAALAAALGGVVGSGPAERGVAGSGPAERGVAGSGPAERRIELHAVDVDPAAVRCARRNVAAAGGQVYEGDLYGPLPATLRGRVGILAANAPYVPTGEAGLLPPEARMHEPQVALDGGADGLDILRRVAAAAPPWLAPGGHLLMETSERQAPLIAEAVSRSGLVPRVARSAELNATVLIASPGR
jgi:release factor glutamine methyltransferase